MRRDPDATTNGAVGPGRSEPKRAGSAAAGRHGEPRTAEKPIPQAVQLLQEGTIQFYGFTVRLALTETGDFRLIQEITLNRFTAVTPRDKHDKWLQGVADTLAAIYRRITCGRPNNV